MTTENKNQSKSLRDMQVGESVVGYIKGFIKAPKSSTPDQEHPVLITKDTNKEIVFWASGDVSYIRERMAEKGVDVGVLCKITKGDKPEGYKGRQRYFATIAFKKDDVRTDLGATASGGGGVDNEGFEY